MNRRQAIKSAAIAGAAVALTQPLTQVRGQAASGGAAPGPHKLPPLPYAADALEPHIDAITMQIHHGKHHAAYVNNLNKAIADYPQLASKSAEALIKSLDSVPEKIRATVRNNAGGHVNHELFWKVLKKPDDVEPEGKVIEAIVAKWTESELAREEFTKAAMGVFGSGWVWLTLDDRKQLRIETTPNQDNPLMHGRTPLLGLDLWEHAYYLKYQNRRADYIDAFGKVINWQFIEERYNKLMAG